MMHLRPFKAPDFMHICEWPDSQESLLRFAGPGPSYPLSDKDLPYFQLSAETGSAYCLIRESDQAIIGFGQILRFPGEIPRIGRLIIDPGLRGQGLGSLMIRELIREYACQDTHNCIELYVLEENIPARRCYEKHGFRYIPAENKWMEAGLEKYKILKMRYSYID